MKSHSIAAMAAVCSVSSCSGDLDERVAALEERMVALESPKKVVPKPVDLVRADDPVLGAEKAEVTVVEVFEFACPYCAMLEPTMSQLVEKYQGQPVRIVPKQFVIHPKTATEPALAVCAANRMGAYERYARALWARSWKQEDKLALDEQAFEKASLIELAESVGLDRDRFEAELSGPECRSKLARDRTELTNAGVRGTPSIFVNGVAYSGPRTMEAMSQAIDQARTAFRAGR